MAAILAAALGAVGVQLVDHFSPRIVEYLESSDPLQITAGYDSDKYYQWSMALPDLIDPVAAPPEGSSCDDARAWATGLGGALVGESWLKVLVTGKRSDGVVINSMRARILERSAPLDGALLVCPAGGAGETVGIGFNLDEENPVARGIQTVDGQHSLSGTPYFSQKYVTVADAEAVAFTIVGQSERSFVRWVVDVVITVDGRQEIMTLGGDQGFATSAEVDYPESWSWGYGPAVPEDEVGKPDRLVKLD